VTNLEPAVMAQAIHDLKAAQRDQVIAREKDLERAEEKYVTFAVYTRDLGEMKADVADIKDTNKWMMRFVITELVAIISAVVLLVAQRGFL